MPATTLKLTGTFQCTIRVCKVCIARKKEMHELMLFVVVCAGDAQPICQVTEDYVSCKGALELLPCTFSTLSNSDNLTLCVWEVIGLYYNCAVVCHTVSLAHSSLIPCPTYLVVSIYRDFSGNILRIVGPGAFAGTSAVDMYETLSFLFFWAYSYFFLQNPKHFLREPSQQSFAKLHHRGALGSFQRKPSAAPY